jgi:transposase
MLDKYILVNPDWIVDVVGDKFGLAELTVVGDRAMITSARATEALLGTIATRVQAGRLAGADAIGVALDGIYVIRTSVPTAKLDAAGAVSASKDLTRLERDFPSMKADDLDLRPIHHYLSDRVRAHVLICMLACYLSWRLRATLAPLTYTPQYH